MTATAPEPNVRVPQIVWAALLANTVLFLAVAYIQAPRGEVGVEMSMVIAMAGAALVASVMSLVLPRFLGDSAFRNAEFEVEKIPDPEGSIILREKAPTIRVFANPAEARKRAYGLFFTPFILGLALCEAVAIFGLVLAMMGMEILHTLPFYVVSWLLIAPRFPTEKKILAYAERGAGARFRDRP